MSFASGSGTIGNPYIITSSQDLNDVRLNMSASTYYQLGANIDLSSYPEWTPIGNNAVKFASNFDGKGYTISNMMITSASSQPAAGAWLGLFGGVAYGAFNTHIKNIKFSNCNINLNNWIFSGSIANRHVVAGILCASASNLNIYGITIESSSINIIKDTIPHATESIGSHCYISLLAGICNDNTEISFCTIDSASIYGLTYASQSYSHSINILTGVKEGTNTSVYLYDTSVNNVHIQYDSKYGNYPTYTTDSPIVYTATAYALGDIFRSYFKNTVLSASSAGYVHGLARRLTNDWQRNWYSAITFGNSPADKIFTIANPTASTYVDSPNEYHYNYYETSSVSSSNLVIWSGSTIGLTTDLMKEKSSYTRWDFAYTWRISSSLNDGYPYFERSWDYIGSGTLSEPYLIYTPEQLKNIEYNENFAHYKLMADLDLSSYVPWKTVDNNYIFDPNFSLDGNYHTISNILLTTASAWYEQYNSYGYTGIFGIIDNTAPAGEAFIKNLTIDNCFSDFRNMIITPSSNFHHISPLVSYVQNVTNQPLVFENVHINRWTASFSGQDYNFQSFGGILAIWSDEVSIQSCSVKNSRIEVEGTHSDFVYGGFLVRFSTPTMSYCVVKDCEIYIDTTSSYGQSADSDNVGVGPFSSQLYYNTNDCYVYNISLSGSSTVDSVVNGFCDYINLSPDRARNLYAGKLNFGNTPLSNVYVVARYMDDGPYITSSYVDTGSVIYTNNFTQSRFTGSTPAQMRDQSTYIGWDFTNIWRIDPTIQDGYPYLSWEPLTGSFPVFTIITPNGGEIFTYNQMIPISWSFDSSSLM